MPRQLSDTFTLAMSGDREFVITRVLDAPRDLVWEVLTGADHIPHWWGPAQYVTNVDQMDVRVGGRYRYVQTGPDGTEHGFRGEYLEVVPPERLVCTFEYEGMPGHISIDAMTLEDMGDGRTLLTTRSTFSTREDRDGLVQAGMESGVREAYDRLEVLAQALLVRRSPEGEVVITRAFAAPRNLVWHAWTDPAQLQRWWAPAGFTVPHCTVDLRPGGVFHSCMRSPEGRDVWGRGVYQEVVTQERIVFIDGFADAQGRPVPASALGASPEHPDAALVTVTFAERGGRTTVTVRHAIPAAAGERQGVEQGWTQMLDRLAALLPA